ncbi:MAG: ankyrin repeat domain-containing protein [Gemmatimonadales bacterium]
MPDETPGSPSNASSESPTLDEQLFDAARNGNAEKLGALLDAHPEKLNARAEPYEWSLLHAAAEKGHLSAVDLLLERGLDANTREQGDNTSAMHWAAAAGHLDVVRRLADAGGDVIGHGDDHQLEVIGWATCWDRCDHDAHRAVVEFLLSRGARHHIYSAISANLADEIRRIVAADPSTLNSRMSRNENNQLPLHYAVQRNRPEMVSLLLELGADPLAVDGSGMPAAAYATSPDTDRSVMEKIRAMTLSELVSAERGQRQPRIGAMDLVAILALGDWEIAGRLLRGNPQLLAASGPSAGVLHMMAKRNDVAAVKWLLEHGSGPNAKWAHWEAEVTPLHLAAMQGHAEIARLLLEAGADPRIRDSMHDSDPSGWADFFGHPEIVRILEASSATGSTPQPQA